MQSGTTGINTTRVYNPIKQALDHDPQGIFVRRWLPAMQNVPNTWLFEPWKMPTDIQTQTGVIVGQEIALPLVDLASATTESKNRLYGRRQHTTVRAGKKAIIDKHASRKRTTQKKSAPHSNDQQHDPQLGFNF